MTAFKTRAKLFLRQARRRTEFSETLSACSTYVPMFVRWYPEPCLTGSQWYNSCACRQGREISPGKERSHEG